MSIPALNLGTAPAGTDGDSNRTAGTTLNGLIAAFNALELQLVAQPEPSISSPAANRIALVNLGLMAPQTPTITSLNTTSGYICGDTPVQINGLGLATVTSVFFGAIRAKFWFAPNDTTIWCEPFPVAVAGAVTITVTVAGGATATTTYTFLSRTVGSTQTKHTIGAPNQYTGARLACLGNDLKLWWGAAYGAAYSYDLSQNVVVFPLNETIPDYIFDICAGPGGKIWACGQTTGSIYKIFDDINFPAQATQLPGSGQGNGVYSVLNICTGPDARLWVTSPGATDSLLYAVDDANNVTTYRVTGYFLGAIIANPNGNLWCVGLRVSDSVWTLVELLTNGQILGTPQPIAGIAGQVNSMRIGIDGYIWAADSTSVVGTNGFLKIPPTNPAATARYVANQMHSMTSVAIDGQGNIWASDGISADGLILSIAAKCTVGGTVTQFAIVGSDAGNHCDCQAVATDANGLPNYPYYVTPAESITAFVTVFS